MTLETLIFDLGNVLVFFDHGKMLSQIGALFSRTAADVRPLLLNEETMRRIECGEMSARTLHHYLCTAFSQEIDYDTLLHAGSDIFTPNLSMINLLPTFKQRLVLLSNTCDFHIDFVRKHYDFLNHFDDLVLSNEVGYRKPDAKIYQIALEKARCPKEHTLFVDDIAENVAGAQAVGLPAHQFVDTETFLAHLNQKNRS